MRLADYPIFRATLHAIYSPEKIAKVEHALAEVARGTIEGSIANAIYVQEIKYWIPRAFENVWTEQVSKHFAYDGKWRDLSEAELELRGATWSSPQAHTIQGMIARILKSGLDTPFSRTMLDILTEIAPIGKAIVDLKGKTVKRAPKAEGTQPTKYLAPLPSDTALAAVQKILLDLTAASHEQIVQGQFERFYVLLTRFLSASRKPVLNKQAGRHYHVTSYAFFCPTARPTKALEGLETLVEPDFQAYRVISEALIETNGASPAEPVQDPDVILRRHATEIAEEIRQRFVFRFLRKLSPILSAKDGFDRAEIIGRTISLRSLSGTLRISFTDGANFVVEMQAVHVVNSRGKEFWRFPVTFHTVFLPGGVRMKGPSEQKMNEIFVKNGSAS